MAPVRRLARPTNFGVMKLRSGSKHPRCKRPAAVVGAGVQRSQDAASGAVAVVGAVVPCSQDAASGAVAVIGAVVPGSQDAASGAVVQCLQDVPAAQPEPSQPKLHIHVNRSSQQSKRAKTRIMVMGARVWVLPENKDAALDELARARATKSVWPIEVWSAAVSKIMKDKFGNVSHGGQRGGMLMMALSRDGESTDPGDASGSAQTLGAIGTLGQIDLPTSPGQQRPPLAASGADDLMRQAYDRGTMRMSDAPDDVAIEPEKTDDDVVDDVAGLSAHSKSVVKWHGIPDVVTTGAGPDDSDNVSWCRSGTDGMMQRILVHSESTVLATYDHTGGVAFMQPTIEHAVGLRFTPQPVVNWLYQAMAYAIMVLQSLLGKSASFNSNGEFLDSKTNSPASGGVVCAVWGTELGARRDQALVAWDYDVDLAVFTTDGFDFSLVWSQLKKKLEPLGLQCLEHSPGYKFRIAPLQPVAFNYHQAARHEAKLRNPRAARPELMQHAAISREYHVPMQNPTGTNCVDIELYVVTAEARARRKGTATAACSAKSPLRIAWHGVSSLIKSDLSPSSIFPVVEGVCGPLRIPLPRTPGMLDAEYGNNWGTERSMKVISGNCSSKMVSVGAGARRSAWPTIELLDCRSLLGGFWGAGLSQSDDDVNWRFV